MSIETDLNELFSRNFGPYKRDHTGSQLDIYDKVTQVAFNRAKEDIKEYVIKREQDSKDEFAKWLSEIVRVSKKLNGEDATIRLDTLDTLLLSYALGLENE